MTDPNKSYDAGRDWANQCRQAVMRTVGKSVGPPASSFGITKRKHYRLREYR
jgi:hypothetical protein